MLLTIKKVWAWIKSYWYVPVVIVTMIILYGLFQSKDFAWNILEDMKKNYRKQIEVIEGLNSAEKEEKKVIRKQYYEIVAAIDERYEKEEKELKLSGKKAVRTLLDKFKGNDEGLAKALSDEFGINYEGTIK